MPLIIIKSPGPINADDIMIEKETGGPKVRGKGSIIELRRIKVIYLLC